MVIGKVSVMDKRFIETDKGMCPGRVPDPPLGGVTLMRDPYVGLEIVQFVILDYLFCVAHYF